MAQAVYGLGTYPLAELWALWGIAMLLVVAGKHERVILSGLPWHRLLGVGVHLGLLK